MSVFLLLGAIVNVAVAWTVAGWSSIEPGFAVDATADETLNWRQRLREDLSLNPSDDSNGLDDVRMCMRRDRGFGYETRTVSQIVLVPSVPHPLARTGADHLPGRVADGNAGRRALAACGPT